MNPTLLSPGPARAAELDSIELLGRSAVASRVKEFVRRAAALDGCVLITAESGCAVDTVARDLHARGRHAGGAFVHVDCASADRARIERVLFGTSSDDALTDLESTHGDSRIAAARGGVLFLQDVIELPASVQARLLRIARDGQMRVDGEIVQTGFRLMASAPTSIDSDVEAHRFRPDLYRRLSAIRIDLPPLRERPEDIPIVAARLLCDLCGERGLAPRSFTQAALALIGALTWPGNVRELRDAIDRVLVDRSGAGAADHDAADAVQVEHLLPALRLQRAGTAFTPAGSLREARTRFEREYIASVLQHHDWHMANAAQTLGIQRPNLYRKARQLGIPLVRITE